ncbi:MAG: hypothetical protein J6Y89_11515, partial [Lachnospiraceae bacterium]|nr:hypothetical protein [Lachnospiraceae bacterium]
MLRVNSLKMPVGYTEDGLRTRILKRLRISSNELVSYNLVKRSVDARDKENIRYVLCVDVAVGRPGQDGIDRKLENKILSDRKIKDVSPTEPVIYKDPGRNINNTKPMNLPDGDVDRNTNGSYLQNNTDMVYDQKKR